MDLMFRYAVDRLKCAVNLAAETLRRAVAGSSTSDTLDTESIYQLVDMLSEAPSPTHIKVRRALLNGLPHVGPHNDYLLNEYRQARLRYYVRPASSPMFAVTGALQSRSSPQEVALRVAIIECLSRIGDHESLTLFDELIAQNAVTSADRALQEAALLGRLPLSLRVEQEPARTSLVRPYLPTSSEQLLRPTGRGHEAGGSQLLHVRSIRGDSAC